MNTRFFRIRMMVVGLVVCGAIDVTHPVFSQDKGQAKEKNTITALFDGIPADLRAKVRDNPVRVDRVNDWLKAEIDGKGKIVEVQATVKKFRPFRTDAKTYRVELILERPVIVVFGDDWQLHLCGHFVSESRVENEDFQFSDVSLADAEYLGESKKVIIRGKVNLARLSRFAYANTPHTIHIVLDDVHIDGRKFTILSSGTLGKKGSGK
jgi:hypothetical protein